MRDPLRCTSCGLPLDPPGLVGLCPACLIKLGLPGPGAAADTRQTPAGPASVDPDAPVAPWPSHPAAIGTCRILRVLGEVGMGIIYLAEQTEPLHRRVAIKVIKAGKDTREARRM